jgi:hypothetical protein
MTRMADGQLIANSRSSVAEMSLRLDLVGPEELPGGYGVNSE